MFLYLVQHGEAKRGDEDPERGLTDKGFREVSQVAAYVRERAVKVNAVYQSGKKRALQTAQIFSDLLKPGKGVSMSDSLAPMDDPELWAAQIAVMNDDIMLVGHLPYLAKLAGLLLCGDKEKIFVDFKMGGIVCLQRSDDDRWALEWMVVPEMVLARAG